MDTRPVELSVPADGAYLVLVRTAAAAVAARLDFTLDRLEDLRLAVDEAASLLLADARPGADIVCRFTPLPGHGGLEVTMSAPTRHARTPAAGSFSWTVLTALVDAVSARADADGTVRITLQAGRVAAPRR